MENDYYRFGKVDKALDRLEALGLIFNWSDGMIPMDEEDERSTSVRHGDYNAFTDPDSFDCYLHYQDPDAPPAGLTEDSRLFLHTLPKRLVLQLLDLELEALPLHVACLCDAVASDTWMMPGSGVHAAAAALVRRISEDRVSWGFDAGMRAAVGGFVASFMQLRLEGRL